MIACPYSGNVDPTAVKSVTKALLDMGCYEVSLGDTVGMGTPATVRSMLETVMGGAGIPASKLAVRANFYWVLPVHALIRFSFEGHFHDTFGTAVANVMTALDMGLRTIDASVGGLGGCPYSPGATGNVATEDVLYALQGSNYTAPGDLNEMVNIGAWISEKLGRRNASKAGTAILAKKKREEEKAAKAML